MKKIAFLFIVLPFVSYAQRIDYNSIILPSNAVDVSIEERLVQLAWQNHPANEAVREQAEIAELTKKQAQWSWLDYIRVQSNINEFTIRGTEINGVNRSDFFPKYNFSFGITLGAFAQTPLEVKKARSQLVIAEENIKTTKLNVRAEVLRIYEKYSLTKKILDIQVKEEQNSETNFQLVEDRFGRGEENIKNYNAASNQLTASRLAKLNAEHNHKIAKIELEQVIGVKVEDVIVD